tara:strand:- start:294 stop:536 length:243 start_codon:yes stop_codon:yes gene_type:complete
MYTIHYTSDVVRGSYNLGESGSFENLSKNEVKNKIINLSYKLGNPSSITKRYIMWLDGSDSYCFFIYKNNKPVSNIKSFI